MRNQSFSVVILGAGIVGTSLGLILARQGIHTLIIDTATHPRFALGESMLKPTVQWMRLLAERFDVPQLSVIANLNKINNTVGPSCGIKKGFGFVRHQPGKQKTVAHWWGNIPVSYDEDVIESHMFRQDVDAYLCREAVSAGCVVHTGVEVNVLEVGDGRRPHLVTSSGEFSCEFLVDCTGFASPVARSMRLRENSAPLMTNSRALFTHMIGVRPFDACSIAPSPAVDWHEGTLHHILDGAWVWVIPFDNQPSSTNPLVSVGVNFDNRKHPKPEGAPQREWDALLEQYPSLAEQFRHAKPVRPWVSTGRLQYVADTSIGERFCLLGQAAGAVDALYSRGLLNNFQSIHLLAELLPRAVRDNDFSVEQFMPLEKLQRNTTRVHDLLVWGSYLGFQNVDFTTWWLTLWSFTEQLSLAHVHRLQEALSIGDEARWREAMEKLIEGDSLCHQQALLGVLEPAVQAMQAFEQGEVSAEETLARLAKMAENLKAVGLNFDALSRLLTEFGFRQSARTLLQVEQSLVMAVDMIDQYAGLGLRLRTSSFVYALIRVLSARACRAKAFSLYHEALVEAFEKLMPLVAPDPTRRAVAMTCLDRVSSVSFSCVDLGTAEAGDVETRQHDGWSTILECRNGERSISLRYRIQEALIREIVIITESRSQRLSINLEGRLCADADALRDFFHEVVDLR